MSLQRLHHGQEVLGAGAGVAAAPAWAPARPLRLPWDAELPNHRVEVVRDSVTAMHMMQGVELSNVLPGEEDDVPRQDLGEAAGEVAQLRVETVHRAERPQRVTHVSVAARTTKSILAKCRRVLSQHELNGGLLLSDEKN